MRRLDSGPKHQVTIPQEVFKHLHLSAGDFVEASAEGGRPSDRPLVRREARRSAPRRVRHLPRWKDELTLAVRRWVRLPESVCNGLVTNEFRDLRGKPRLGVFLGTEDGAAGNLLAGDVALG